MSVHLMCGKDPLPYPAPLCLLTGSKWLPLPREPLSRAQISFIRTLLVVLMASLESYLLKPLPQGLGSTQECDLSEHSIPWPFVRLFPAFSKRTIRETIKICFCIYFPDHFHTYFIIVRFLDIQNNIVWFIFHFLCILSCIQFGI